MTQCQIILFGAPRVVAAGERIALPRRKALALLAYLAATGTVHTRDSLAALLWGDSDEQSAHAYLRNALWTLNKALGADWADVDSISVALRYGSGLTVDVMAFNTLASQLMHVNDPRERLALSMQAIEIYTGEFMAGFTLPDAPEFTHWQITTAESLQRTASGVLMLRLEAARQLGDSFAAADSARRWVALDPLDERAHRALMQVLADSGEVTAVVRQYHDLTRRLRDELGARPEAATVALYEALTQPQPVGNGAHEPVRDMAVVAALTPNPSPSGRGGSGVRDIEDKKEFDKQTTQHSALGTQHSLVGRERERDDLLRLLAAPDVRLITVVAPGGMGKTQLATQIRADAELHGLFPDGVYWVPLAPLCSADEIVPALAAALPYGMDTDGDIEARVHETLRGKRTLLVLDNFEHLLDSAPQISGLLESLPSVRALVTSRERLNLRDERVYELHGLSYPRATDDPLSTTFGAVELFIRRAQQAAPGFTLGPHNAADVAHIARLVEGMPLALELAASWTPLLTCAEIAQEVQESLDFLTSPARDVPERHRSVRAVFDYTWEQMTREERAALSKLAVFRGGFRLDAASAVAAAPLRVLLSLAGKTLLKRRDDGRFEIHELLRQYAEGMLDPETRLEAVDQHIEFYAGLLAAEAPRLRSSEQRSALDTIQSEIDNIRSAWRNAVARRKTAPLLQMIDPLTDFLAVRSRYDDLGDLIESAGRLPAVSADERVLAGKAILAAAIAHATTQHQVFIDEAVNKARDLLLPHADRPDVALWLVMLGAMKRRPGRIQTEAESLIRSGLEALERNQDLWGYGFALYEFGTLQHMQMRYAEARETLNNSLHYFEKLANPWGMARALEMLAENMQTLGNYSAARDYLTRTLDLYRELGMTNHIQRAEIEVAWLGQQNSRVPSGAALLEALQLTVEAGDRRGAAWMTQHLASIAYHERDYAKAERLFMETLRSFRELGDDEGIIWANIFLAAVALEDGRRASVDVYVEAAQRVMEDMEFPWGVSGVEYVQGDAALYDGDLSRAWDHYRRAVEIAYRAQSILQVLRHLSGIADVRLRWQQPEEALTLAVYTSEHPTSWDDTRRRAGEIIAQASALLPVDTVEQITAAARTLTLDEVVQRALT